MSTQSHEGELWFVTGSQHLYGPEPLRQVAADAEAIVGGLNDGGGLPLKLVCQPVVTTADEIRAMTHGLEVEPLGLSRSDNALARGLWLRQPASEKVVIYFGGNAMRIADSYRILEHLLALDSDVVWLDHRGLGASSGQADMEGLMRDGLETFDHVAESTDKPVVLYGLSLGSFIAGYVAVNRPAAGLILEASATTAEDWARALTPWYATPFVRLDIQRELVDAGNEQIVQRYTGPLFILVGEDDETTPVALSRALYDMAASGHKTLYIAPDKGHGNALTEPVAKRKLKRFVESL